jgi:hypothetical protein
MPDERDVERVLHGRLNLLEESKSAEKLGFLCSLRS